MREQETNIVGKPNQVISNQVSTDSGTVALMMLTSTDRDDIYADQIIEDKNGNQIEKQRLEHGFAKRIFLALGQGDYSELNSVIDSWSEENVLNRLEVPGYWIACMMEYVKEEIIEYKRALIEIHHKENTQPEVIQLINDYCKRTIKYCRDRFYQNSKES